MNIDICSIIAKYINEKYELLDWININRLNNKNLSLNKNAIDLLKKNPNLIEWSKISGNKYALDILIDNKDKINWFLFSFNKHPDAIKLLKKNQDKINWSNLSLNKSKEAIELLKENRENIDWTVLSFNPYAIELLKENLEKINWYNLSLNYNAIKLLKKKKIREKKKFGIEFLNLLRDSGMCTSRKFVRSDAGSIKALGDKLVLAVARSEEEALELAQVESDTLVKRFQTIIAELNTIASAVDFLKSLHAAVTPNDSSFSCVSIT